MKTPNEIVCDPNPDVHGLRKELCEIKGALMEAEWKLELYKERLHDALQERPKGKWEWVQYDANPKIGNWHCSNCRHISNYLMNSPNFCPNCGAQMEK